MRETIVDNGPRTAADWRRLWSFTLDPFRTLRRPTREVRVGDVGIGGANPIRQAVEDTQPALAQSAEVHR